MRKIILVFCIVLLLNSCEKKALNISFYHWKTNADFTPTIAEVLESSKTKKIYLHYFDIENKNNINKYGDNIFPTYVVQNIDKKYNDFEIIPTVYISNSVLLNKNLVVKKLAEKVEKLINQINLTHFKSEPTEIQIDCDWTQSTKNTYFELLEILEKKYEVSATIRLHQIKFQEKTGVPPLKKGTLMLYNVGDLKNSKQNSILESNIVDQYIKSSTKYPLELSVALPLFSQTVIFNNDNNIKLSSFTEKTFLDSDLHFKAIDKNLYEVVQDTLFKGFYLSEGFQLKLEESLEKEIIESYKIVKNSKLKTEEIIFYHLEDESLNKININDLIKKL